MASQLDDRVYVCVMSGFNLGSLEGCLARRPAHVVLVVSDSERFQQAAERFQCCLQNLLPGVQIHRPDQVRGAMALSGDDLQNNQQWTRHVLLPYLQQRPELTALPRWLNFTGGTKSLIMTLLNANCWQRLDYRAMGATFFQTVRGQPEAGQWGEVAAEGLPWVPPYHAAALNVDYVKQDPNNKLEQVPGSIELAEALWQGQANRDPALTQLFCGLEKVWGNRDEPGYNHRHVQIPLTELLADKPCQPGLIDWLQRLATLSPDDLQWEENGETVMLPGNKASGSARRLRDWISGDWLEQLVWHWLVQDSGLPDEAMLRNLKAGEQANDSATQREADVFIHYRGRSLLLEIKAGLPPGHQAADMANQVGSLGNRFGATGKALLVGPALKHELGSSQWESFKERCESSRIQLLEDKEMLLAFVNGTKPEG